MVEAAERLLVFEDHMLASGVGRCVAPVAAKVSFVASRSTYTPATVCLVSACAGACTRLTLPVMWFVRARPARAKLCLHTCGRMHRLCPAYVLCRAREACAGRDLPLLIFVHAH